MELLGSFEAYTLLLLGGFEFTLMILTMLGGTALELTIATTDIIIGHFEIMLLSVGRNGIPVLGFKVLPYISFFDFALYLGPYDFNNSHKCHVRYKRVVRDTPVLLPFKKFCCFIKLFD